MKVPGEDDAQWKVELSTRDRVAMISWRSTVWMSICGKDLFLRGRRDDGANKMAGMPKTKIIYIQRYLRQCLV